MKQATLNFRTGDDIADAFFIWANTTDGKVAINEIRNRAMALKHAGVENYGIAGIWEAMRYDHTLRIGKDPDGYKLNNNHRAVASRYIEELDGRLKGFFTMRNRTTTGADETIMEPWPAKGAT